MVAKTKYKASSKNNVKALYDVSIDVIFRNFDLVLRTIT